MRYKSTKGRRPRRITQADYRAGGEGLARDCAEDVARGLVAIVGPDEYQCAVCDGIFAKCRPDEEAAKEYAARSPDTQDEPRAVVCDDCFRNIAPELSATTSVAPVGKMKFPRDDGSVGRALGKVLHAKGYRLKPTGDDK